MNLQDFASQEGISEALAAKVLGKLRHGGIVSVLRGRKGGYELAQDANSLTVSDVLKSLGRPLIEGCFTEDNGCLHADDCGIRPIWQYLSFKIAEVLEQITLSDLIKDEPMVRSQIDEIAENTHGADK